MTFSFNVFFKVFAKILTESNIGISVQVISTIIRKIFGYSKNIELELKVASNSIASKLNEDHRMCTHNYRTCVFNLFSFFLEIKIKTLSEIMNSTNFM